MAYKAHSCVGFGVYLTKGPCIADPGCIYKYGIHINFWYWRWDFGFIKLKHSWTAPTRWPKDDWTTSTNCPKDL